MEIVNGLLMRPPKSWSARPRPARRGAAEWLAAAGLLALLVLGARHVEQRFGTPVEVAGFGEAIDGDSLKVAGLEIRLKGIDAPELAQWCQNRVGRDYACGVEAKAWLRSRLRTGAVICAIEGKDRYGRLLGLCRRGNELLNATMVREGKAVDYGDFPTEEEEARRTGAGLWSGRFVMPSEHRAQQPPRQ